MMENPAAASAESKAYRFSLPQGWTFSKNAAAPTMTCPEGDLHVSFVQVASEGAAREIALAAWRKLDPGFKGVILHEYPAASSGGWDKTYQVIFATPANESRVQLALIRTLGSRAYVNVIRERMPPSAGETCKWQRPSAVGSLKA
jgi:hypothetical protein